MQPTMERLFGKCDAMVYILVRFESVKDDAAPFYKTGSDTLIENLG